MRQHNKKKYLVKQMRISFRILNMNRQTSLPPFFETLSQRVRVEGALHKPLTHLIPCNAASQHDPCEYGRNFYIGCDKWSMPAKLLSISMNMS